LVLVSGINHILRLAVAVEIVRDQVVITVVDGIHNSVEVTGFTKGAVLYGIKDALQLRVKFEARAVFVGMAKILNVLGKVSKQEDVVLTNLASNFNLVRALAHLSQMADK